jgi:hypothetical protein
MPRRSALPKYVSHFRDRDGKNRYRFRRGVVSVYMRGDPGTDEFAAQYWHLVNGTATPLGVELTRAGSFNCLAVSYYSSPGFRDLAPSTQIHRRRIIDKFRSEHGNKPIKLLQKKHIADFMAERADTPEAANNLVKLLKVMLDHAVDLGMIDSNPARSVKRYRNRARAFILGRIWRSSNSRRHIL